MKIFADAALTEPVLLDGGIERRVLSYGGGLMLVEFTFPAGTTLPLHDHPHEQIGYVVSGEIILTLADEETRLQAGSSYYVAPHVSHGAEIITDSVLIDCFTPVRADLLG